MGGDFLQSGFEVADAFFPDRHCSVGNGVSDQAATDDASHSLKFPLAVDEHALVFTEIVELDFLLFGFVVIHIAFLAL